MSSSDDDDDPFALPGTIKTSKAVAVDDVSSDDDCGTNAWLKSGQAKKDALKEKERLRNLRTQAEGTKPSDGAADGGPEVVNVEDGDDAPPAGGPSPKRARREGKKPAPSGSSRAAAASSGVAGSSRAALDASPQLDAEDAELLAKLAAQRAKQAQEYEKRRNAFHLDDDDEGSPAEPTAQRPQGGGRARARGHSAAAAAPRKAWLKVHTDGGNPQLFACAVDAPLNTSDLRERIAKAFCFEPARLRLRRGVVEEDVDEGSQDVQAGEELDLGRTPAQLGLASSTEAALVWADEAAIAMLNLKLRYKGKDTLIPMCIAPTGTFGELLQRFCAQHETGLTPQQCKMSFDGDALNANETPQDHDLEDDDLIEVGLR